MVVQGWISPSSRGASAATGPRSESKLTEIWKVALQLAIAPEADLIYLHYEIVLEADRSGFDIIAAFQAAGHRVDAWTIRAVTPITVSQVNRLLALKVDQITTDDPEGLAMALTA